MSFPPKNLMLRIGGWAHRVSKSLTLRYGKSQRLEQERAKFYDTIWRRAAESMSAQVADIGDGMLEFVSGNREARVVRNYTPLDDAVTLRYAGNKPAVHERLALANIPTPAWRTFSLNDMDPAIDFLQQRTCVVKPARYTGAGSGVTTNVQTRSQLRKAVSFAFAFDRSILIEEQIAGENYRLLFLDGELLEVVQRHPPTVTGNGKDTIASLVKRENQLRIEQGWRRAQTLISFDADFTYTLRQQGMSGRFIPQADEVVRVKTVINENRAAENELVSDVAGGIVDTCREAASAVGCRLAGVDIVCADIRRPFEETGGVVLEVNTTPGLYHHYDETTDDCRVAIAILQAIFAEAERRHNSVCKTLEGA